MHHIGAVRSSILVTGADGGLGTAIMRRVLHQPDLAKNHYGLYTTRTAESAASVQRVLRKIESTQHAHQIITLDQASFASVRKTAEDINKRVAAGSLPPIQALVLNSEWDEQTTQTRDSYLAHFMLSLLVLQSMDKDRGRIIVVGSRVHK